MTERDGAVPFREVVWEEAGGRRLKTGVLEEAAREIERRAAAPAPPALDVERLAEGLQANYGHAFPTGVDWLSDAEQLLRDARLAAQQDTPET